MSSHQPLLSELKSQLRTSIPATFSLLLYRIPWLISLYFVGQIGSRELAAAALATTLCNVTGMSLSVGLSSAITTLAGQARGRSLLVDERGGEMYIAKEGNNGTQEGGDGEMNDEIMPLTKVNGSNRLADDHHEYEAQYQRRRIQQVALTTHDQLQPSLSTAMPSPHPHPWPKRLKRKCSDAQQAHFASIPTLNAIPIHETPPNLPLVYLYRGMFIQILFVLPIGCFWLYGTKPTLLYLGQGEELSAMTEQYLRILTPGLWAYSVNYTLTAWLQVMELAYVPAYAALLGCIMHVPFNLFFISALGLGWLGVGVATTMFQIIQPICMLIYLCGSEHGRLLLLEHIGARGVISDKSSSLSFWREAKSAISSFAGIRQYLSLAIPGILAISEWWASEVCIFLAGKLTPHPDIALGAMAVYQSLNTMCFMLPMGLSIGGSARIGTLLGSGDVNGARVSAAVCVTGAGIVGVVLGYILYLTPHTVFPSFFSTDDNLVQMTSRIMPLLSLYVIGDGCQAALNGVVKGCGRQCVLVPVVIIAYWCIAIPIAWYFTFVGSGGTTDCHERLLCGVVGLVAGLTIGTWVHFILLAAYCACMIDWRLEAKLAEERLSLEATIHDDANLELDHLEKLHLTAS